MLVPPDVPTADLSQSPALTRSTPGAVPGPVDRVHFLDEQRRYRRAPRRFTALAAFAVLITGIPACIVVTPLIFTVLMTLGHIINALSPIPPEALQSLREWGQSVSNAADSLETALDSGNLRGQAELFRVALAIGVLVLPGALALFAIWIAIRRVLGHVAV